MRLPLNCYDYNRKKEQYDGYFLYQFENVSDPIMFNEKKVRSRVDWDWYNVPISIFLFFSSFVMTIIFLTTILHTKSFNEPLKVLAIMDAVCVAFGIGIIIWNNDIYGDSCYRDFFSGDPYYRSVSKRKARKIILTHKNSELQKESDKIKAAYIEELRIRLKNKI